MLTEEREACAELGQGVEQRREFATNFGGVERDWPRALCGILELELHLRQRDNEHARSRYPAML